MTVTDPCRSGAVAACAGPLEASVLHRDPALQPRRPADGVRGRGRGVPGHPHHRQHAALAMREKGITGDACGVHCLVCIRCV